MTKQCTVWCSTDWFLLPSGVQPTGSFQQQVSPGAQQAGAGASEAEEGARLIPLRSARGAVCKTDLACAAAAVPGKDERTLSGRARVSVLVHISCTLRLFQIMYTSARAQTSA